MTNEILRRRQQRVAASLLENESLTGDLDDRTAKPLLAWGLACAKTIVNDTADLDDAAAEDAMYPRLRALRRLMRNVSRWITKHQRADLETQQEALSVLVDLAAMIYGPAFSRPDMRSRLVLLLEQRDLPPPQVVNRWRQFLEPASSTPPAQEADARGEEDND